MSEQGTNVLSPEYQNMQYILEDAERQLSPGAGAAPSNNYPTDFDEQLRDLIDSVPITTE